MKKILYAIGYLALIAAVLSGRYKITFSFLWFDFWRGGFYDQKKKVLYVCPLPCCVFKIEMEMER